MGDSTRIVASRIVRESEKERYLGLLRRIITREDFSSALAELDDARQVFSPFAASLCKSTASRWDSWSLRFLQVPEESAVWVLTRSSNACLRMLPTHLSGVNSRTIMLASGLLE